MKGVARALVAAMCVIGVAYASTGRAAAEHAVTSLSPDTLPQATQSRQVVITGSGFSDALGAVSVEVSGSGVSVGQVNVTSPTRITASFSVSPVAALGFRHVTVRQGLLGSDTTECQRCLTITAQPTITAFTPTSGTNTPAAAATTNLTVNGSGFVTGSVLKLRKSGFADVVGTGVAVASGGTSLTATLDLTGQAAGRWVVIVENPDGGHAESGNGSTTGFLTTGATPSVTALLPSERAVGTTGGELTVVGMHFARGATVVFGGTGVTVTEAVWDSLGVYKIKVDIALDAPLGPRSITVTNLDGGTATLTSALTVTPKPTASSVTPGIVAKGVGVDIQVNGAGFEPGAFVEVAGPDVDVGVTTFVSSSMLRVRITASDGAQTGLRTIVVTNDDGGTATCACLTLVEGPTISSISPTSGTNDSASTVQITGSRFPVDAAVVLERPGFPSVPLSNRTVSDNGTRISGSFDLSPAGAPPRAPGAWTVRVTDPSTFGSASLPNGFLVDGGAPDLLGVTPAALGQGSSRFISLSGANFAEGSVVTVSGSDIGHLGTTVLGRTEIHVHLFVGDDAAVGPRTVTVTNADGQSDNLANALSVNPKPTIESVAPSSINQGTSRQVTIAGTGFASAATLRSFPNSKLTYSNVVRQSSTQLTATVTAAADSPPGSHSVIVDNPDGGEGSCLACLVVVAGGAVRLDGWQRLGDPIAGGTGVASVVSDTAGVFFRAPDNSVRFRSLVNNGWTVPASLGGVALSGPAAAATGGTIDVIVRGGDDGLWVNTCSGGSCGGWSPIGGRTREEPAAVASAPGRLDVLIMGLDSQLWQRSRVNGTWGPWTPQGGILSAGPAATSAGPGNIELAVRGSDGSVWGRSFNGSWGPYVSIGGFILDEPALAARPGGFVDLFVRAVDNRMWYGRRSGGTWVGFQPLGGGLTSGPAAGVITGTSPNPTVLVAVRGGDGRLWVNRARFSA